MAKTTAPPAIKWADLGVRSLSAAVLAPFVLLEVWLGGVWFEVLAALLGVLMALEWTNICHDRSPGQFAVHALAALCAAVLPGELGLAPTLLVLVATTIASCAGVAFSGRPRSWWSFVGVPYVALPVLALVALRSDPALGLQAIVWLVLIVWAADILAYFAGRIIGGPKLAPVISPKKTWAGLGGAIVGAAIASGLYGYHVGVAVLPLVLLAAALAVVEQGGDIFESSFKRRHGVKDSGTLIPGHGGILDRVDGLVAMALVAGIIGYSRDPLALAKGLLAW